MPTAAPTLSGSVCDDCGQLVLNLYTSQQRAVVLDADPTPAGLFTVDDHGRAARRSLTDLYAQRAGLAPLTDGYEPHACTRTPWWARD